MKRREFLMLLGLTSALTRPALALLQDTGPAFFRPPTESFIVGDPTWADWPSWAEPSEVCWTQRLDQSLGVTPGDDVLINGENFKVSQVRYDEAGLVHFTAHSYKEASNFQS